MRGDLERRASREEAKERTLEFLHKQRKPALIGEVALAIGHLWTLEDAETLLEQLSRDKLVRRVDGPPIRYEEVRSPV